METRAAFLLSMEVARLLGKQDCNEASDVETQLLRLLTPITKLYTAKQVRPLLQTKNCVQDQGVTRYTWKFAQVFFAQKYLNLHLSQGC